MTNAKGPDNSGKLFDNIKRRKKLSKEIELAQMIGEHPSVVSEIRHGKRVINDMLLMRICERVGISIKSARSQIADRD